LSALKKEFSVGIREKLNENQKITTGVTIGIIALAVIVIIYQLMSGGDSYSPPSKAYYTVDDGATFFEDDIERVPPYDYNGQTAVKALVYDCGDGKKFVGVMQRYNKKAHAKMTEYYSKPSAARDESIRLENDNDRAWEVKKPGTGDKGWVPAYTGQGRRLFLVTCPNGGDAILVDPN
jgi:hypothetical protein